MNEDPPPGTSRRRSSAGSGNVGLWLAVGGGALFILTCVAVALFVAKMRSANSSGVTGTPATPGNPAVMQAPARPAAPVLTAADEKALAELGGKVADTVNAGDATFLDAQFNNDRLIDRLFEGIEANASFKQGFSSVVAKGLMLGTIMVKNTQDMKAKVKFLRVHRDNGENRMLFRLYGQGLNYTDICVEKNAAGKFEFVDEFNYSSGEMISLTMRRMTLPMVVDQNKSYLEKLVASESDYVKSYPDIQQMGTLCQQGQWAAGLAKYNSLPQAVREDKSILLLRLTASSKVGPTEEQAAIGDFRRLYPADPALDLLCLDRYLADKDYVQYQAAIDRLEKRLGADACLEEARANGYYAEKKLPETEKCATAATKLEPDFANGYWTLVQVSLDRKKYDDTVKWLGEYEKNVGGLKSNLGDLPQYKEFGRSDQYKQWQARHSK